MLMHNHAQALGFTLLMLQFAGCSTDYGTPYVAEGPLPLAGPGLKLVRYQQSRHHPKLGRIDRTLWSDGGAPTDPMGFIKPLRDAIPQSIHEKLRQTTLRRRADGREFEQSDYYARANLVCLKPDVMVLTMRRSMAGEPFQHPFHDFIPWSHCDPPRSRRLEEIMELMHCDGPQLCFLVGRLLPYSEEMYLISTDPAIGIRELVFEDDRFTVETGAYSFHLLKTGTDVIVAGN